MLEEQHKHVFHIATKGLKQVETLNQIRDDEYKHIMDIFMYIKTNNTKQQNKTKHLSYIPKPREWKSAISHLRAIHFPRRISC